jgi:hypothetical protein
MPSATSSTADTIAGAARRESPLWADALRAEPDWEPVFSPLAAARFGLGLETVYEAYLVHFGRPRLFAPPDRDTALLLGDYLYAHGLVRIAETGDVAAVAALSELISTCARLRAEELDGDGEAWVGTALSLSDRTPAPAEVERALAAHALRLS